MTLTRDDLVDALRQVRNSPAPPANLGTGGASSLLKGLGDTAQMAGGAIKGLVEGNVKFSDAVGGAGQVIGKLGTAGKIAGDSLTYMGKYAQESVDAMRSFGKFGAGFNGDAIAMRSSIAQTNMSLEEYGKFLNKNTGILNAMGGSVTQGTTKFNEFSQAFFDQQAKQGDSFGSVSDQLRNLGMTSEEINGTLAIELASRRFQNMEDTKSREDAIASAASMATEMDKIAKLTGKSRETQQAELAALEKDGQYQAAIRLAQRQGNTFAAEGMKQAMTSMGQFGAPVQNLVKDFLAFGTASKDTQDTLAALGPAGTELQNAIQMVKSAKTEEQKIAAQSALKRAEESVTAEVNSTRLLENAAIGIKGFKGIADSTTTITAGMDKVATENKLNLDLEVDRRKAAQILQAQAKKEQDDAKTQAKPGDADAGKATTQAIIQFEKVMQSSSAAIQEQFVNRLNKEIAPGMIEFTQFLKAPGLSRERQAGAVEKGYTGMKQAFENPAPGAARTQADGVAARQSALDAGKPPEEANRAATQAESRLRPRADQPTQLSPTRGTSADQPVFVQSVNAPVTPPPMAGPAAPPTVLPRSGGTYGAGKMFEDVGSILQITKPGEVVLNGEQQMNLARGMMDKGAASAFANLSQNLDLSKITAGMSNKNEAPKVDISKMMGNLDLTQLSKNFTTQISSVNETVSGGGAKTIQGPDIKELSKSFEKSFADMSTMDLNNTAMGFGKMTGNQGMPAAGSQLTESASIEKLAQEQIGIPKETIQQTNNIAEQTQSMLASKKDFYDSELQQIGHELSTLDDEKQVQLIRQAGAQASMDRLQIEKDIYENNQKYDERDLLESTEELAMLRNRIDNSESAAEIQELQAQIANEEALNLSLQSKIAERNQNILNTDSEIALKEQELQDLKEEMADTEIAIQDKQSELLDYVSNQGEIVTESDEDLALYGANQTPRDTEFGDLAGAIAKNKTQTTTGRDPFASMLDRFMGPMSGPSSATAGVDAAKNSAVKDAEKKDADAKQQAQAAKTATATATDAKPKTTTGAGKETTLSDVVASLDTLNMQVGKLSGEMSRLPNLMEKSVSATKALNGNLNMRA